MTTGATGATGTTGGRTLVRNGHVLTMDPALGDLPGADVLIEDGRITAVGPSLDAAGAEIIDATGHLVLPGLIDTHRHTWQSLMRGICGDWTLADYYFGIRLGISPAYEPDDVRLGNLVGGVDALDSGVTTLLDFSHCNNTPEHSDAAVRGLQEAGIRAAFCYGFFESSPEATRFGTHADRLADYHRVADTHFGSGGLLTLGVSLSEIFGLPWADTVAELAAARERNALLVNHSGCVFGSVLCGGITELDALGLLGPDIVHVHCTAFGDEEWAALARSGGKVSFAPETELNMGFGIPPFDRCRSHGIAPTLSADVISLNSGDLWHQLRFGLGVARSQLALPVNRSGAMPDDVGISCRDALSWCTADAADALGLGDRTGSLTPGKQADLILVGGAAIDQHPRIDPYSTLVFQTSAADVRTVLVDGRVVKRDGVLTVTDLDRLTAEADSAADRILGRVRDAGRELPGTPPGAWAAIEPMARGFRAEALRAVAER
ncbi:MULTISPECIES: amidohydrolase family protein [Pseudonocardia]|uniref:Atrazine chlorohydrolase n=2 Tax=Pseudonocardia TaxID=1847 RepID=A0A1Y2MIT3_PSEAH|nr:MULTISPECIES: amidohydrolase family protein [Pseudonocardia]OSY34587.1 Atrazine chlorohydrolase [Pseudonocardia autotrophica]TDN71846.1 cytosine/adenosine deaminase-related metal-dependent hydrolase [Pseudonocardia autotrophica]BBG02534.1 cytosine deaminase [Pseudonocardia autotrophica]GEC29434.1 cytosine deaminase [Pseudonocardia saturnea]